MELLPLRQQATIRNNWLTQRLDTILPELMARTGLDMWLIITREYNEDPVIMSLLPEPAMSARRRTILVFNRMPDGSVERFTVSRYGYPGLYETVWDPAEEEQFACLARLIKERNPSTIGINTSQLSAFADGMPQTEYAQLTAALGEAFNSRLVSAEMLVIGWLERRLPEELTAYSRIVAMGHALIDEAFSAEIIHPGITTTDDVVWWMRQAMHDWGVKAWFQPSVELQAPDIAPMGVLDGIERRKIIMPGDLLHCDVGFHYLGLATDQQQHAYVLRPGETDAPAGLRAALATGNRLQDIHMEQMGVGKTGNEVLAAALAQAKAENIDGMIYSHPLGYHGHAAGPTIGLWDRQDGVPGKGEYPIYDDTAYSIELNIAQAVPEWGGQQVRMMLEEDAMLTNGEMHWLDGRMEELLLVG